MIGKAEEYFNKGGALYDAGLYEKALKNFNKALELAPDNVAPWNNKGNSLKKLCRHDDALEAYNNAIELNANIAAPWNGKGGVLNKLGQYDDALVAFSKAIELDPKDALPWNGKGNSLINLGRYDDALEAFDKAIELNPKDAHQWNGKGNALYNIGYYEEALEVYNKAIELNPKDALPWSGKGNVLNNFGRYDDAFEAYNKAIALDPKDAQPWDGKGNAFIKLGRYDDALEAFDNAIELDPKDARPWLGKGIALKKEGRILDARGYFFRCYYLAYGGIKQKIVDNILTYFDKHCYAPLFIYRIFCEFTYFQATLNYMQLWNETSRKCVGVVKLLGYLEGGDSNLPEPECAKLRGLIYYHMGDPLKAYEIFDCLDDSEEYTKDTMVQIYLVWSMDSFYVDSTFAMDFAVKAAEAARKAALGTDAKIDVEQLYYAGHIYYQNDDLYTALECFNLARDFLPARYMEMLMLHMQDKLDERDRLIEEILLEERSLSDQDSMGFILGVAEEDISLLHKDWSLPLKKIAQFYEISEAIKFLYRWLDEYKARNGSQPPDSLFINTAMVIDKKPPFESWRFSDETERWLEGKYASLVGNGLRRVEDSLKSYFTEIPLIHNHDALGHEEIEIRLAEAAERGNLKEHAGMYHLLVTYYFHKGRLPAQGAVRLHFFISLKEAQLKGQKERPGEQFLTTAFSTATGSLAGAAIAPHGVHAIVTASITGIAAGSSHLVLRYIRESLKEDWQAQLSTYKNFKSNYFYYISNNLELLESEMNDYYPFDFNEFKK